jgi:hypothetical protein
MKQDKPVTTFLCHSSGDKPAVRELHQKLRADGVSPWLDEIDLLPGTDWKTSITNAVQAADSVLICLSKTSIAKTGFVQKEILFALDRAEEQPEGRIYLIPARLEPCVVPQRLSRWQWVDLFTEGGYERLLLSLSQIGKIRHEVPAPEEPSFAPFKGIVHGKLGRILCQRCENTFDPNDKSWTCSHHNEPPTIIGNTGPHGDYADVWRFPCCNLTVIGAISERGNDIKPPISPGCVKSMHLAYEA